jgi:hypothetical protein
MVTSVYKSIVPKRVEALNFGTSWKWSVLESLEINRKASFHGLYPIFACCWDFLRCEFPHWVYLMKKDVFKTKGP